MDRVEDGAELHLAQQLAARLCHDLGGGVGTLAGLLDVVEGADDMLALARETANALRDRLRLYATAWGGASDAMDAAGCGRLLAGAPAATRVRFDLGGLGAAVLPPPLVPIFLNASLLAAEALPRGGTVSVGGDEHAVTLLPEGPGAAWTAEARALARGAPAAELLTAGPRRVVAPLLAAQLAGAGWVASLPQGDTGTPPLVLCPA